MIKTDKDPIFQEMQGVVKQKEVTKSWTNSVSRSWRMLNRDQRGMIITGLFLMLLLPIAAVRVQQQAINFSKAEVTPSPVTFGKAANLNGTDSYFDIPPLPTNINPGLGFTFEAWVRPTQPEFDSYLIAKDGGNGVVFGLTGVSSYDQVGGVYNLTYEMAVADSSANCVNKSVGKSISLTQNQASQITSWTHVAGVIENDGQLAIYVNGQQMLGETIGGVCQANSSIQLGARKVPFGVATAFFPGVMDEVRLSSAARYNATFDPPRYPFSSEGQTIGLYHFDGNPSDYSGNGYHANDIGGVEYIDSTLVVVLPSPSPSPAASPEASPTPDPSPSPQVGPVPTITTNNLPPARVGRSYSTKITANQNPEWQPLTMDVSGLPGRIGLAGCETKTNPNTVTLECVISGTPTNGGDFVLTVTATDSRGVSSKKELVLIVK